MTKIYKYFPHEVLSLVFEKNGFCGLKCAFPKDYNDPFELFLSIGQSIAPDTLAFYNDVVQDIPQRPTTCFSKSPLVTPMWAHYANNQTGFVLEFDSDQLEKFSGTAMLKDVKYQNDPNNDLIGLLHHAAGTKKPRHSYFLTQAAFDTAYFTKTSEWSYEKECRLIALEKAITLANEFQLLVIPTQILSAIIIGANFPEAKIPLSQKLAQDNELDWYNLRIGKSTNVPYMENIRNEPCVFSKNKIILSKSYCLECSEPNLESKDLCPWCSITKGDRAEAAMTNPFRILDAFGQLEDYIKGADAIGRKQKK